MVRSRVIAGGVVGALVAAAAVVAPALGATEHARSTPRVRQAVASPAIGGFTPVGADPRLAAIFGRGGLEGGSFRFTPAEVRRDSRAVTVAVRAQSNRAAVAARTGTVAGETSVGMAPIAYNLGVAVGWKRFAVAGDVSHIDQGPRPGSRQAAEVSASYTASRFTGSVKAASDRPLTGSLPLVEQAPSYSVDLSSSYALTRNLAVTAGVRYRSDRERIAPVDDVRRDSQAVYVGTAFRF